VAVITHVHEAQEESWESNLDHIQALRRQEIEEANLAVQLALEAYRKVPWYTRAAEELRFFAWWLTYKVRLVVALFFTKTYCRLTGKDSGQVSRKVWYRLGI
jgi:hypothetical protein